MPAWPQLRREVLCGPGGQVLHERLVRGPGSGVPLAGVTDLRVRARSLRGLLQDVQRAG